ncbi:MAG: hypothetical protein IPM54_17460 [Polyangiaceae bacterium]|nr:hypothetical protein [Polyangiaceae bacterium]
MSAERPNHPAPTKTVLIVGLRREAVERASEVLEPSGAEARLTTMTKLREDTAQLKPVVLLVDAYLYDFDPHGFEALARDAGAKLGVVKDSAEAVHLLKRVVSGANPSGLYLAGEPNATQGKLELDTAKYDAKTIEETVERMGAKRLELDTARYDSKTIEAVLERMDDS